jgi:hypothetical protein
MTRGAMTARFVDWPPAANEEFPSQVVVVETLTAAPEALKKDGLLIANKPAVLTLVKLSDES